MRITSKGQVTIPQRIREQAGLHPQTEVEFAYVDGIVTVRAAPRPEREERGDVFDRMVGVLKSEMTTDEIMALLRDE